MSVKGWRPLFILVISSKKTNCLQWNVWFFGGSPLLLSDANLALISDNFLHDLTYSLPSSTYFSATNIKLPCQSDARCTSWYIAVVQKKSRPFENFDRCCIQSFPMQKYSEEFALSYIDSHKIILKKPLLNIIFSTYRYFAFQQRFKPT